MYESKALALELINTLIAHQPTLEESVAVRLTFLKLGLLKSRDRLRAEVEAVLGDADESESASSGDESSDDEDENQKQRTAGSNSGRAVPTRTESTSSAGSEGEAPESAADGAARKVPRMVIESDDDDGTTYSAAKKERWAKRLRRAVRIFEEHMQSDDYELLHYGQRDMRNAYLDVTSRSSPLLVRRGSSLAGGVLLDDVSAGDVGVEIDAIVASASAIASLSEASTSESRPDESSQPTDERGAASSDDDTSLSSASDVSSDDDKTEEYDSSLARSKSESTSAGTDDAMADAKTPAKSSKKRRKHRRRRRNMALPVAASSPAVSRPAGAAPAPPGGSASKTPRERQILRVVIVSPLARGAAVRTTLPVHADLLVQEVVDHLLQKFPSLVGEEKHALFLPTASLHTEPSADDASATSLSRLAREGGGVWLDPSKVFGDYKLPAQATAEFRLAPWEFSVQIYGQPATRTFTLLDADWSVSAAVRHAEVDVGLSADAVQDYDYGIFVMRDGEEATAGGALGDKKEAKQEDGSDDDSSSTSSSSK